jgi:hypothetical protein
MAEAVAKITKRDNYATLRELVLDHVDLQDVQDRLLEFIDHEVELISQRAEKSKAYQKEHKASNDAMTDLIMDTLTDNGGAMTVADIVGKITDSTPQKVVYRLGQLFKSGRITKETQTIKSDDAPARKVTFYTAVVE